MALLNSSVGYDIYFVVDSLVGLGKSHVIHFHLK